MKKLGQTFLLVLVASVFATAVAYAAEVGAGVSALTSTDAGSTNVVALSRQQFYRVECALPACIKPSTDAGAADCSTDSILEGYLGSTSSTPTVFARNFDSASSTFLRARALDGGNPACNVFLRTRNLGTTFPY